MTIIACTSCGKKLRAKPEQIGRSIRCPACGSVFQCRPPTDGTPASAAKSPPKTSEPADPELQFLAPAKEVDEIGRLGGFRVLGKLGAGGMGLVLLAEDPMLQRKLALKVMQPSLASDTKARARFLREAQSAAKLVHENVITVHSVGEHNGVPYLAMPLLKGLPLDKYLEDRKAPSSESSGVFFAAALGQYEPMPMDEVLKYGTQIAEGLAAAHDGGLVHRDIKPANIWLEELPAPAGTRRWRVKILDFGLARSPNEVSNLSQSGIILGSPAYMAPEQARGEKIDHRADLFALGCVLYEMATGQRAFPGDETISVLRRLASEDPTPPKEINTSLPPGLSPLILQLLEKDAADRPASAHDVVARLEKIARGEVDAAEDESFSSKKPKGGAAKKATDGAKSRSLVIIAIAVGLLAVAGIVLGVVLGVAFSR
jgi:serine/threonine protein kinase/DNA-directed RNA polymerase subunit RPC12/RpoP